MESKVLLDECQFNSNTVELRKHEHQLQQSRQKILLPIKLKNWVIKNISSLKKEVVDELLTILKEEGCCDLPSKVENLLTLESSDVFLLNLSKQLNQSKLSIPNSENYQDSSIPIKEELSESWIDQQTDEFYDDSNDNYTEKLEINDVKIQTDPFKNISGDFSESTSNSREPLPEKDNTDSLSEKTTSEKNDTLINIETDNAKLYFVIKEDLRKMETRWSQTLESMKRSLLYDIVRKYEDLRNRLNMSARTLGTSFTDDKEILGVKIPFHTVDSFCEFDKSIADNPEKEIAMKSLMTNLCFGASTLSASIGSILSAFLTKDLQMQYSACGKKIRGVKKKNFGDTYTFQCAKDVLREKHETGDAEVISKTSRWFTGAGDRDGGRKRRRLK